MEHYIDISIFPNSEFSETVLMNALYSKFHKALWALHSTSIGVSFPKYHTILGSILRIHGEKKTLQQLHDLDWQGNMSDYCMVSAILSVPVYTKFRTVSRIQPTMHQSKLRRLIKRGSIPENEISQYEEKMLSRYVDHPYVELRSGSNGHRHRRYIALGQLLEQPIPGEFDQFGLSKTATVPWFD